MIAPYLVLFAITTGLVAIAGSRANRSRLVRWVSSIAAVTLVSVFAGARDYDVGGPDVLLYGNKIFSAMLATPDVGGIMAYAIGRGASGEFGYYFLNWIVSRFTDDPHVFYSVLAAVCSGAVLIAILILRDYGPPAVMWLTYLLTAYVEGFNLLRQGPSLALAILGIAIVLRSRYKLGLVVGASGLLFHNSAVVFFVMWAVAVYLKTRKDNIGRAVVTVLLVSAATLLAISPLLDLVSTLLSGTKYESYLSDGAEAGRSFSLDALYRLIPIVLGIWALRSTRDGSRLRLSRHRGNPEIVGSGRTLTLAKPSTASDSMLMARRAVIVVLVLLSLELILLPVREFSYPFYRLLVYFGYIRIIGYGLIVGLLPKNRFAASVLAIAFAGAYFASIVIGRNEAFYSSEILNLTLP